jgi:hypothetical protein
MGYAIMDEVSPSKLLQIRVIYENFENGFGFAQFSALCEPYCIAR